MTLEELWNLLGEVRSLSFVARIAEPTGWNGRGFGTVDVRLSDDGVMTFTEQGTWQPRDSVRALRFRNLYRWTLAGDVLRLEHLRFGVDNPVYLFDLAQVAEQEWRSVSPHLCREDCYTAVLTVGADGINLRWTIAGPRKREVIEYAYIGQQPATPPR
jgi:hypothetical protein